MVWIIIALLFLPCASGYDMYFRVSGTSFQYRANISDPFVDFGRFGAVNMGVTNPGYSPGEVILRREDYLQRFHHITQLGVRVVRVYALHHPDFYSTLLEWNQNHDEKLYVLHGTLFPEEEFEYVIGNQSFGGNTYGDHINELMRRDIRDSVIGVYGKGTATYRYAGPEAIPIEAEFTADISSYLIGWVVGGEVSPFAVRETNLQNPGRMHTGMYISSGPNSSPFESWLASILDYIAVLSDGYGVHTPITHTNWATTDGISNPSEPRYPDSVEDFAEIDLTHLDGSGWDAGLFYNQHAYPYYPNFISLITDPEEDPYFEYIRRLREHYDDKPFLVTEVGIPTSVGIASIDPFAGRNHGHVSEDDQGRMIANILTTLINDVGVDGVVIFQLYDEWFKKTWNVKDVDIERNTWMNVLSAEQKYGLYEVMPYGEYNPVTVESATNDYIKKMTIINNEAFLILELETEDIQGGSIVVGFDTIHGGTNTISNQALSKNFVSNSIDAYINIIPNQNTVEFLQLSTHNIFQRRYGVWLNGIDNYFLDEHINDIMDHSKGIFYPYIQLVKIPGYYNLNGSRHNYTHLRYTLEMQNKDSLNSIGAGNLGLWNRTDNRYRINIPYGLLGYTDPSDHKGYILNGQGRSFEIQFLERTTPIHIEASYVFGNVDIGGPPLITGYRWSKWGIPKAYYVKPKYGFTQIREAFTTINGIDPSMLLPPEDLIVYRINFNATNEEEKGMSIHQHITFVCMIFLTTCFFFASLGKWIANEICYCYAFQNDVNDMSSKKLQIICLILLGGMIPLFIFKFNMMEIEIDALYIVMLILIIWDSLAIYACLLTVDWNIVKLANIIPTRNPEVHAFIVAAHNSSTVLTGTIKSLLTRVPPECIYIADNGSTIEEIERADAICDELTIEYYNKLNKPVDSDRRIMIGHSPIGNKTVAQYITIMNLPDSVEFVTCVDDDTILDPSWDISKVLEYFNDPSVAVLAYPLRVHFEEDMKYELEFFQQLEYLVVGQIKLFQSKIRSTIFNSGAFGTYRVELLREACVNHSTEFNGDDLQLCLNIHESRLNGRVYKVKTAKNMVAATITPKCWFHLRSFHESLWNTPCSCDNPDLFGQRVKGWVVSQHRFAIRYFRMIFDCRNCAWESIWLRFLLFYELIFILAEYFSIFYLGYFVRSAGWWLLDNLLIGFTINIMTFILFNFLVLKKNRLGISLEIICTQPIIYKVILITLYKYIGLIYNLLIYTWTFRKPSNMRTRMQDRAFVDLINTMYDRDITLDDKVSAGNKKKQRSLSNAYVLNEPIPQPTAQGAGKKLFPLDADLGESRYYFDDDNNIYFYDKNRNLFFFVEDGYNFEKEIAKQKNKKSNHESDDEDYINRDLRRIKKIKRDKKKPNADEIIV